MIAITSPSAPVRRDSQVALMSVTGTYVCPGADTGTPTGWLGLGRAAAVGAAPWRSVARNAAAPTAAATTRTNRYAIGAPSVPPSTAPREEPDRSGGRRHP